MNEQEMADLFSAQIDRILAGESAVDGDLPLLALGQQLSQVSYQASPAAQATFASQLASWYGPASGLSTTIFGLPKTLVLSLGAALAVMSAGLGLVVLISFIWTGALPDPAHYDSPPAPTANPRPESNGPVLASPPATRLPAATTPTPTRSRGNSSKDALPTVTTSVGDTILIPTLTPTEVTPTFTATLASNQDDDDGSSEGNSDTSIVDDHDRGHGNDPDGYDEDNPGQSDGVSGGNDQNNGSGGISPGNLSGGSGSGGDNSGGGNAGGGGNSNGGNGGGHGGGKGNN